MKPVLSLLLLCLFATSGYSQTDQKNPYGKLAPTPNSKTKKHDFGKAATAEIYKQASNSDLWIYRFDPPNFDPEKDKRPAAESLLRPAGVPALVGAHSTLSATEPSLLPIAKSKSSPFTATVSSSLKSKMTIWVIQFTTPKTLEFSGHETLTFWRFAFTNTSPTRKRVYLAGNTLACASGLYFSLI